MSSVRIALVAVAALLAAALCAGPALAGHGQDVLHEVQVGDNLHLIAGYYYGDCRQWERIWRANRAQLGNPSRIERGTWLRVPDADVPVEPYADFLARMGVVPAGVATAAQAEAQAVPPQAEAQPPVTPAAPQATPAAGGEPAAVSPTVLPAPGPPQP
jgi:hypothetical protein